MKKLLTSSLFLAATLCSFSAYADTETTVGTKAELEAALNAASNTGTDVKTTIYIKPGSSIAMSNGFAMPVNCDVWIVGQTDEENPNKPMLGQQSAFKTQNDEGTAINMHFQNLQLETNGGRTANSKYMFGPYKNAFEVWFGTLEFLDCDFTNYNRAIIRAEHNSCPTGSAGEINTFRIENCKFYDGYGLSNPMALFVFGIRVNEMVIRNNSFYRMGYLKDLWEFGKLTGDNVIDTDITFENNTVIATATQKLMSFGTGDAAVGQMANYHINNNIFMVPNWIDDFNNPGITDEILAAVPDTLDHIAERNIMSVHYGIGEMKNNILIGYRGLSNTLDEEEEGATFIDSTDYKLDAEALNFGWSTFTDAKGGLFGIWKGEPIYTAGYVTEEGQETAPVGDINLYVDTKQEVVTFAARIEGSESASISISPAQEKYLKGDVITVTVDTKGLNEVVSWSNGMTGLKNDITLDGDLDLVITCREDSYYAIWNLEQITKNGTAKASDLVPNYAKSGYKDIQLEMVQYVDSLGGYTTAGQILQTRGAKMTPGKPCIIVRDSLYNLSHVAYLQITIPEVTADMTLSCELGTENYMTKVTALEASTDGQNWTAVKTIELGTANSNTWNTLEGSLAAFAGKQNVVVRIKGDETQGFWIGQDVIDLADAEGVDAETKLTFYFPYFTNFRLVGGASDAIETVAADRTDATLLYDLQGRLVSTPAAGTLYIMGGKKLLWK